jgi:hypothetical protein
LYRAAHTSCGLAFGFVEFAFFYGGQFFVQCLTKHENIAKLAGSVLNMYSGCHWTAQTKCLLVICTASMMPSGARAIGIKSLPRSLTD